MQNCARQSNIEMNCRKRCAVEHRDELQEDVAEGVVARYVLNLARLWATLLSDLIACVSVCDYVDFAVSAVICHLACSQQAGVHSLSTDIEMCLRGRRLLL